MQNIKNSIPYVLIMGIFLLLKWQYRSMDNEQLAFLLYPTDTLVGLFTSSHSVYFPATGYYHETLQIVIDKSCSGFNFGLLCFLSLSFLWFQHFTVFRKRLLALPILLAFAYVFTIIVNTSRIVCAIFLSQVFPQNISWLHQAEGAFVYLSALVGIYIVFNYLLEIFKNQSYAKFA